jgi:hypothetical protein
VEWQWDKAGQWHAYSSAESFDIERYFLTYQKFQDAGRSDLFRAEVRLGGRAMGKFDFRDSTCQVGQSAPKRTQRIVKSQDWLSNLYFYNIFKDILKKQGGVDVTAKAEEMFEFRYNQDFRSIVDDGRKMTRGGEEYKLPFGWKRFSVNVKDEYDDGDNAWLREDDSGWAVAYHGTSGDGLGGILMSGFRVGPRQKFAATAGSGIYCTPLIDIAQHYSAPSMLDGHSCQIVLQLRVRPASIRRITDPKLDWMERQYWVLDPSDIRAYGVLIRELAQKDYVTPIQRAYNDRAKGIK